MYYWFIFVEGLFIIYLLIKKKMVYYIWKDKGVEGMKWYGNMMRNLVIFSIFDKGLIFWYFMGIFVFCYLGFGLLFIYMLVLWLNIYILIYFVIIMVRNYIEYIIVLLKICYIFKI